MVLNPEDKVEICGRKLFPIRGKSFLYFIRKEGIVHVTAKHRTTIAYASKKKPAVSRGSGRKPAAAGGCEASPPAKSGG
ncbi:hypothetical protein ACS4RT_01560 [Bacillus amyloliquefaciens]